MSPTEHAKVVYTDIPLSLWHCFVGLPSQQWLCMTLPYIFFFIRSKPIMLKMLPRWTAHCILEKCYCLALSILIAQCSGKRKCALRPTMSFLHANFRATSLFSTVSGTAGWKVMSVCHVRHPNDCKHLIYAFLPLSLSAESDTASNTNRRGKTGTKQRAEWRPSGCNVINARPWCRAEQYNVLECPKQV